VSTFCHLDGDWFLYNNAQSKLKNKKLAQTEYMSFFLICEDLKRIGFCWKQLNTEGAEKPCAVTPGPYSDILYTAEEAVCWWI